MCTYLATIRTAHIYLLPNDRQVGTVASKFNGRLSFLALIFLITHALREERFEICLITSISLSCRYKQNLLCTTSFSERTVSTPRVCISIEI